MRSSVRTCASDLIQLTVTAAVRVVRAGKVCAERKETLWMNVAHPGADVLHTMQRKRVFLMLQHLQKSLYIGGRAECD